MGSSCRGGGLRTVVCKLTEDSCARHSMLTVVKSGYLQGRVVPRQLNHHHSCRLGRDCARDGGINYNGVELVAGGGGQVRLSFCAAAFVDGVYCSDWRQYIVGFWKYVHP